MKNRWFIPLSGFLLALMGGLSYSWGVFVLPMMERYSWSKAEATIPFTVFMVTFAIVMVPGGWLQDKIGPRKTSAAGALLFFVAYGLAALVDSIQHHLWLVLSYGFVGGIACGLTYACIAPPARKWFPDKPGLAISFSVMGFGLAALFFAPLKAKFLIPIHGIGGTFLFLAVLASVICFLASRQMTNPPSGWLNHFDKDVIRHTKTSRVRMEAIPREVLKSPVFWDIWIIFALVITGGFISLGLIPSYAQKILHLSPVKSALAISVFACFNGFGRPLAGYLGDRFGVVWVMIITYFVQMFALLFFPFYTVNMWTLYLACALLGLGYAVNLGLFPVLTSICFGVTHLGVNYGLMFTAFGVGAIAPLAGSWLFDLTGSYSPAFVAAGIMAGVGLLLSIILKKKHNLS